MKIVLQRVAYARVRVQKRIVGEISKGYLLLLGVEQQDTKEIAEKMADKIQKLRLFEDGQGKTNLSAGQVKGEVLIVSQFTLCADCRKGNRPSFMGAAKPDKAAALYEYFITLCQMRFCHTAHGMFGENMEVELCNDGPFTLLLNSEEL